MEWNEVFKLTTAVLTSLGGGGMIVMALSGWLGKVWAERIARIENTRLEIELEKSKRYDEYQFRVYNEFWARLCDLRISGDDLWQSANNRNLHKFASNLKATKEQVMKSSLLIDSEDYRILSDILYQFSEFQVGKMKLIDLRSSANNDISDADISNTISQNGHTLFQYKNTLEHLEPKLRQRIRGLRS